MHTNNDVKFVPVLIQAMKIGKIAIKQEVVADAEANASISAFSADTDAPVVTVVVGAAAAVIVAQEVYSSCLCQTWENRHLAVVTLCHQMKLLL